MQSRLYQEVCLFVWEERMIKGPAGCYWFYSQVITNYSPV